MLFGKGATELALSTAPPFPVMALGKVPLLPVAGAIENKGRYRTTSERTKLVLFWTMRASINTCRF